jgi:23S rRNA pseudouridine1911/1915/1917 synthase
VENKFAVLQLIGTVDNAGLRIDKALAAIEQIATRSQALKLLQQGLVRIAGRVVKPSYQIKEGDQIEIQIPIIQTTTLEPYDFPLNIVYEDADLIVVDKPAGLVVHPAYGHAQDTLVNALLHHTKDLSQGFHEQRPGLVHRIDKDTSGLLVIAKNEAAQRFLSMQFQRKTTHRVYRALAFGKFAEVSGTYQSYLKRHPDDRKRVASVIFSDVASGVVSGAASDDGVSTGKLAITHYRALGWHSSGISLIELKLETGRTHQIRVHLSENSHPIIGDNVYGAEKRLKNLKSVLLRKMISELPRFALHAMELGFVHPTTKKNMRFRAPWPQDLMPLIEHLGYAKYDPEHVIEITD